MSDEQQEGIRFLTQRKSNAKRARSYLDELAIKQNRKRIEVTFSEITARFPCENTCSDYKRLSIQSFLNNFSLCFYQMDKRIGGNLD